MELRTLQSFQAVNNSLHCVMWKNKILCFHIFVFSCRFALGLMPLYFPCKWIFKIVSVEKWRHFFTVFPLNVIELAFEWIMKNQEPESYGPGEVHCIVRSNLCRTMRENPIDLEMCTEKAAVLFYINNLVLIFILILYILLGFALFQKQPQHEKYPLVLTFSDSFHHTYIWVSWSLLQQKVQAILMPNFQNGNN